VPVANPKVKHLKPMIDGDVPSPINPPSGCAFHTRCQYVMDRCRIETPRLAETGAQHQVACWLNEGTGRTVLAPSFRFRCEPAARRSARRRLIFHRHRTLEPVTRLQACQ